MPQRQDFDFWKYLLYRVPGILLLQLEIEIGRLTSAIDNSYLQSRYKVKQFDWNVTTNCYSQYLADPKFH